MNNYVMEPRQETVGDILLLEEKVRKRRLSLEDNFMNYGIDDLLFGSMYYLATFHPEVRKLYLTKKNYAKNRKNFYNLEDGGNAKTLKRHLDKLIEKGLVAEEDIKVNGESYPSYVFPYNYKEKYQLVEAEMLWYIISTRNRQAVKIYIQLLNWYLWKEKTDEQFVFTNKDIMKVLGYSTDNKVASSMVSNVLESLSREGVIKYENYFEEHINDDGRSIPTPKKRLLFVAKSKSELPAVSC